MARQFLLCSSMPAIDALHVPFGSPVAAVAGVRRLACAPSSLRPLWLTKPRIPACRAERSGDGVPAGDPVRRRALQAMLWAAEGAYVLWLFLLTYAPGDPVWAISTATIKDLIGLSLNFFFILPLSNSAGIHLMEAPILHPMAEGLFNFVIAWTLLFAPLLYTDHRRDRYKGSLDALWGFQMFLTNTFLIPYMAIRLNDIDKDEQPAKRSKLGSLMVEGAPIVGAIGIAICLFSIAWALYGRADGNFGVLSDRWQYLMSYLATERLAYAFIWDIILYSIFQPWLIGENLMNLKEDRVDLVNLVRFIPVLGIVAYVFSLDNVEDS